VKYENLKIICSRLKLPVQVTICVRSTWSSDKRDHCLW